MPPAADDRYAGCPPGFFDRADARDDGLFYAPPRLVTHIDDAAVCCMKDPLPPTIRKLMAGPCRRAGGEPLDGAGEWRGQGVLAQSAVSASRTPVVSPTVAWPTTPRA